MGAAINRRWILSAALLATGGLSAVWPRAVRASIAPGSRRAAHGGNAGRLRTVYDPRFPRARAAIARLGNAGQRQTVGGDATELALWLARRSPTGRRPILQGITTASIPFCLAQMNPRRTLRLERLDRDLCYWQI